MIKLETEIGPQQAVKYLLDRPNILDKEIFYSDALVYHGDTITTSISSVGEYSLEYALKTILDSNPNVTFKSIQYSKKHKKLYFYTDDAISTEAWKQSKIKFYSGYNETVFNDVENLIKSSQTHPEDTISLLSVARLSKKVYDEIEQMKKYYLDRINTKIEKRFPGDYHAFECLDLFNYDNDEMEVYFSFRTSFAVKFKKKDNDLYISECDCYHYRDEILPLFGDELSKLYDLCLQARPFQEYKHEISSVNSRFTVQIWRYGTGLYISKRGSFIFTDFCLETRNYGDTDDFEIKCDSNNLIQLLKGNEKNLFDKIYIKIDDCPKWMAQLFFKEKEVIAIKNEEKRIRRLKLQQLFKLKKKTTQSAESAINNAPDEEGIDKPKKGLKQRALSLFKR